MAWRCLGGAAPLALPPARHHQCVQPRLRVQLPRCATLRASVVSARLRPSGRAYAPHWGAPRVRRLWRRRICRALGAPLPWRAPCGGSTGGTLRARVSRAASRPLRASAPRAPPQYPRHGCRFAAPWRTSPPRGLGAPIRRALGAFAPLGGRCRQLLHSARALTRIRFTSKIFLDYGGDKCYNISSTKRALQPAVLFPQSLNASKGYHIFPARVKWYPLFFHLFFANWSASAYSIVTASSEWFKSRCTRSMLPCAW